MAVVYAQAPALETVRVDVKQLAVAVVNTMAAKVLTGLKSVIWRVCLFLTRPHLKILLENVTNKKRSGNMARWNS